MKKGFLISAITVILGGVVFFLTGLGDEKNASKILHTSKPIPVPVGDRTNLKVNHDIEIGNSLPTGQADDSAHGLSITFRDPGRKITLIDEPERLVDIYVQLSAKAEKGELNELTILLSQLLRCKKSWRSVDGLEKALAELNNFDRAQLSPDAPAGVLSSQEDVDMVHEHITSNHHYCQGLSDEQIDRYKDFAKIGSDKGDLYSTEVAIEAAENEYEKLLLEKSLWERSGFINGLTALSDRYFEGLVKRNGTNDSPDYKRSFAYFRAEEMLRNANAQANQSHEHNIEIPSQSARYLSFQYFERRKAKFAGYLSPAEEIEAEAMAQEIIQSNENCCESFPF